MADAAKTLMRPMRARVLEALAEPGSAASVARELGVARQKVRYHLMALESEGLVELVESRKKGNCTERIVQATARSYLSSAEVLAKLASRPADAADRFSSGYLVAVAARAVRDVAVLRDRAETAKKKLPTLTLQNDIRFATPAARHAFATELANAVAELVAKYHDGESPNGRDYRLFAGVHPALAPSAQQESSDD